MMSHMVEIMEEYMCCHFKIETVHVMSTSSNHGKSNLMHIFSQNFSHHSAEEGYSQACLVYCLSPFDHEQRYVKVQEIRVYF